MKESRPVSRWSRWGINQLTQVGWKPETDTNISKNPHLSDATSSDVIMRELQPCMPDSYKPVT